MTVYYDIALSFTQGFFSSRIREICGQFDLSFFLVEPIWAYDFVRKLQEGEVRVRVLIDMGSDAFEPDNLYFLLAQEVKRTGGYVINDPDYAKVAAHKGLVHEMLVRGGVPVPETVIVKRSELESFRLTDEIKAYVGMPFVVKPGWGGGGTGVILNGRSEEDLLRSATLAPNSDSFLMQRKLSPKKLEAHVGWFRGIHIFDEVIPCWWEPPANQYQVVTPLQERLYKLRPITRITKDIGRVARVKFFSTEIALNEDGRFLAVDYVNTGPDMHPKSFWPTGVPDEVVRHVAWSLVDRAMSVIHRKKRPFAEELEEKDLDWGERRKLGRLVPGE
jgi:hypothetical protein